MSDKEFKELEQILDEELDKLKWKTVVEETVNGYVGSLQAIEKYFFDEDFEFGNKKYKIILKECKCQ
jgi:hypothetical protein